MTTLSINARRAIALGIVEMNWNNSLLSEYEQIWCGIVWVNDYLDKFERYSQTAKVWQKIERELTKAFRVACKEDRTFWF